MKPIIPYGKQEITDQDIDAVVRVLKSDFLTQGPEIAQFEDDFKKYVHAPYAVAVANGTAALHLAVLALGVKSGQTVLTSPITFAASANAVRYAGGNVDFIDINPETLVIDLQKLEEYLKQAEPGKVAGIIPVSFAGYPANTKAIKSIAEQYNCWVLEDACHAPGAHFAYENETIYSGDCKYSDITVFSFHPVKHIATGEGGMITVKDPLRYERICELRTHGITRNPDKFQNTSQLAFGDDAHAGYPAWYMEMQQLGYNYRITDIQAALGISQLKRAEENLIRRKTIARRYNEAFKELSQIHIYPSNFFEGHAFHLYVVGAESRFELYEFLKSRGIYCQIHYFPVHLMPYYQNLGFKPGDFPVSENYYKSCISLPMFPSLKNEEQEFIINSVHEFYKNS